MKPEPSIRNMKYKNHIITPQTITVVLHDGRQDRVFTVSRHVDQLRYQAALTALKAGEFDQLPVIMDITHALKVAVETGGEWATVGDKVYYAKVPLPATLSRKFLAMAASGVDVEPIKRFWMLLIKNPQEVSRDSLFSFIDANGVTITDDGHFILYKGIRSNWTSHYDGTTLHKKGEWMPRLKNVNLDPHVSCGAGYHAAPWQYVRNHWSGGIIVELRINPADVISVPHEDCQKIRNYTYFVMREVTNCDDPRKIQQANIKTGDLEAPKAGVSKGAQSLHAVQKMVKKVMKRTGLDIEATTDRITIPGSCILEHGFQSNGTATVWATDPRSRFLLVCPTPMFKSLSKDTKVHWSKEVVVLSTGSLSIRGAVLAQAKIWNGPGSHYKIAEYTTKILEVRPA